MKKPKLKDGVSEMRAEYDFTKGIRGKYAKAYSQGSNIVALDPDVAKIFPDSKAVNDILRALARVASRRVSTSERAARSLAGKKTG